MTVNYRSKGEGTLDVHFPLCALNAPAARGDEDYVARVKDLSLTGDQYALLNGAVKYVGVTPRFRDVIRTFDVPAGETPAGFRIESTLQADGLLEVDLVRDISYDKNGMKRPTRMIYSADSANPYEVAPIAPLLGNLTCNPGIVYDLFINNPKVNVGGLFKTREEVMGELGRILGPGCDISVELNNPFAPLDEILEEAARFKEMLSEYRVVIKVPHTGPVNGKNVHTLIEGNKKFPIAYDQAKTEDYLYGHNLALALQENGYRVNYTLMFEPWQTGMALQAKPYFINSFINKRMMTSTYVAGMLSAYDTTRDLQFLKNLRSYFIDVDFLPESAAGEDLAKVEKLARETLTYRDFNNCRGFDGLDGVRHNLRMLKDCSLDDTRLIICSIAGSRQYPELDKLLVEDEFRDVLDKIVITTEPIYLAQYTASPQIITYQRRFMNAVNNTADKR